MAAGKSAVRLIDAVTCTSASTISASAAITSGYGAVVHCMITNGTTGPTLPCSLIVYGTSETNKWFQYGGQLTAGISNGQSYSWASIEIPVGTRYMSAVATGNTVQNVVVDVYYSEVTTLVA